MGNSFQFTIYYESYPSASSDTSDASDNSSDTSDTSSDKSDTSSDTSDTVRDHRLLIIKRYCEGNTKELIAMINGDSLLEAKQVLRKLLPLVEAGAYPGGGRNVQFPRTTVRVDIDISCRNCDAGMVSYLRDEEMKINIREPDWYHLVH